MAMKFGIGIFFGVTEFGPGIFWVQPRSHAFFFGVCVGGGGVGGGVDFSPIRSSLSLEIPEYLAWGREPKM